MYLLVFAIYGLLHQAFPADRDRVARAAARDWIAARLDAAAAPAVELFPAGGAKSELDTEGGARPRSELDVH